MALASYNANDITYTISLEPELPDGMKTWAVVQGRVIDEITGRPPNVNIRIDSPTSGVIPRVGRGGQLGLVAIPRRAFPDLRNSNYPVSLTIEADGYLPVTLDRQFLADANFPTTFTPIPLGDLQLHRVPTVITGRAVLNTGTEFQPIAGAIITLTGIWLTPPAANMMVPPSPPDLVSLAPGLYFDRPQVGTAVQPLDFQGAPGPDKRLLGGSRAGENVLQLSDRVQINNGDILAIDTQNAERTEYISIQSMTGASTDDQPARITLDAPLRLTHANGAVVHRVQFQNVGVLSLLTRDAIAGDVCLFVNAIANLAGAPLLSLQGGGTTEFHATAYFNAVSDAQGFYRLPPISRVAQCAIRGHDGVHADLDQLHSPAYGQEVSRLDFVYQ